MLKPSASMSAKTGSAPHMCTTLAVAMKLWLTVMTSSSGLNAHG